jgi:hypothetical protein
MTIRIPSAAQDTTYGKARPIERDCDALSSTLSL